MRRFIPQQSDCRRQSRSSFRIIASLLATAALSLVTPLANAAPQPRPEQTLRAWSKASQLIVGISKSAQQRAFLQHEGEYNSHQIALMNEFKGPVDADELLERYRFTEVKRVGTLFRLTAVNRDDVERLFVAEFEVEFSDDAYLPISLQFVDADGKHQGDAIALLTNPPQTVAAVFDQSAVNPEQTGVRVASAVENPATNKVQQADVEFPAKQGEDSKRLQEVLNNWKAQALRTKTMRSNFHRWEYDHVFHTEKRTEGTLAFRAPDQARIQIEPGSVPVGATSQMLDKQGNAYRLEEGRLTETVIWWKDHCCHVSHELKQIDVFQKSPRPVSIRKASFFDAEALNQFYFSTFDRMLPVFGGWSANLETDFDWSLTNKSPTQLQLKGVPQAKKSKQNFEEIVIILDSQSYRVRAAKFVNPGRTSETVYNLHHHMRNVDGDAVEFAEPAKFEVPKLPGYRTIKHGRQ